MRLFIWEWPSELPILDCCVDNEGTKHYNIYWNNILHRKDKYTYGKLIMPDGKCRNDNVRLNNKTNEVEFILWKAGEQEHTKNFWHSMDSSWKKHFIAN